jgi:hypothetical protein
MSKQRTQRRAVIPFFGIRDDGVSPARAIARRKAEIAVWADIRAFPPLAVIAGLDCLAALVLWRKFAGGAPLVLTNARLCLAGLAIGTLIVAARWWLVRMERESPAVWLRTILMVLAVIPMLVLLSMANSHHSPWAVSFTGALVVVSGGAVLLRDRPSPAQCRAMQLPAPQSSARPLPATQVTVQSPAHTARALPAPSSGTLTGRAPAVENATVAAADGKRDEWMERTTDESGAVNLRGRVLANFSAGQSVATVHIPFCPVLPGIPEFTCDIEDDPSVHPRAPAVYRYGARVELKRTGDTSHPASARLSFQARTRADSSRAA